MQSAHLDAIAYLFYFFFSFFFFGLKSLGSVWDQAPLQVDTAAISDDLFWELDELARIVDISYCVTYGGIGIQSPFQCLSWCREFADFELVTVRSEGSRAARTR